MKDLEKGVNAKTLVEREIAGPVHTIAAHLQRYSSELTSTKDTLQDIKTRYDKFARVGKSKETSLVYDGLDRIASHLQQLQAYVQELKDKASNIIALVSISPPQANLNLGSGLRGAIASQLYSNRDWLSIESPSRRNEAG